MRLIRLRHDEKRGQNSRQPRQLQRGGSRLARHDRLGEKRTLERVAQVERGIGDGAGEIKRERLASADQHRGMGRGGGALIRQLERDRARVRNQHVRCGEAGFGERGFGGQQVERAVHPAHPDRPAMAQRIERARNAACAAHKSNSVISGT